MNWPVIVPALVAIIALVVWSQKAKGKRAPAATWSQIREAQRQAESEGDSSYHAMTVRSKELAVAGTFRKGHGLKFRHVYRGILAALALGGFAFGWQSGFASIALVGVLATFAAVFGGALRIGVAAVNRRRASQEAMIELAAASRAGR